MGNGFDYFILFFSQMIKVIVVDVVLGLTLNEFSNNFQAFDKDKSETVAVKKMAFSGKQAAEKWSDIIKEVSCFVVSGIWVYFLCIGLGFSPFSRTHSYSDYSP